MGDILSTISKMLACGIDANCHIIFHYPPNHNYELLIPALMSSFEKPLYDISYEVRHDGYSIDLNECKRMYGAPAFEQPVSKFNGSWWFSGNFHTDSKYYQFKTTWKKNFTGPIALALNHKDFNENHPIQEKFFTNGDNEKLQNLIDNERFFLLGDHMPFERNIELLSTCRYALGIEGGWTHVTNAMRVPFIIAVNKRTAATNYKTHPSHPRLFCIASKNIDAFTDFDSNPLNGTRENLEALLAR